MRYVIDHEQYGESETFRSLKEAIERTRDYDAEFAATTFTERDGAIVNERGEVVGQVKRDTVHIEVCTNEEWLSGYGEDAPEGCRDEIAATYRDAVFESLADSPEFDVDDGDEIENAKSGRILYHGWNGAMFDYRSGGVGVWGKLSDAQKKAIDDADDAGASAVNAWVKSLPPEAYPEEEDEDEDED